jgi:non-ribosomal peptide synthetase component F
VRAEGAISGLRVRVFTAIAVQHTDDLPLACDDGDQIAQAATPCLPAGWRWLTDLDPAPRVVA